MLKNLLMAVMISGGISTANLRQPERRLNSDSISQYFELQGNYSHVEQYKNTSSKWQFDKWTTMEYNNAMLLTSNVYIAGDYEELGNNGGGVLDVEYNTNESWNTTLIATQITPYANNYNNNIDFNLEFDLTPVSQFSGTIRYDWHIITSTAEEWMNYIDVSNYKNITYNRETYNDLTSGEYGLNFNIYSSYEEVEYSSGGVEGVLNINQDIPIISDRNNYIYTFIELTEVQQTSDVPLTDANQYGFIEPTDITIDGVYVPYNSNDYEVIDIPNIMFTILSMPFTFVSQAFNLTLFPNTPYQLNISNLFLSIIAVLIFVFIMKLFLNR